MRCATLSLTIPKLKTTKKGGSRHREKVVLCWVLEWFLFRRLFSGQYFCLFLSLHVCFSQFFSFFFTLFLIACTRLYNPLCLSVGWLVFLSLSVSVSFFLLHEGKHFVFSFQYNQTKPDTRRLFLVAYR